MYIAKKVFNIKQYKRKENWMRIEHKRCQQLSEKAEEPVWLTQKRRDKPVCETWSGRLNKTAVQRERKWSVVKLQWFSLCVCISVLKYSVFQLIRITSCVHQNPFLFFFFYCFCWFLCTCNCNINRQIFIIVYDFLKLTMFALFGKDIDLYFYYRGK